MATKPSPAYKELIRTLVEMRSARGITQRDLAEILGTSQAFVSNIERAQSPLRLDDFTRWVIALEAPGGELFAQYWADATRPSKRSARR